MGNISADEFILAAIEEARKGLKEGGIPIGSVLVHRGKIIGRGHNRRIQEGSVIKHGEMDALENAGRFTSGYLSRMYSLHNVISMPNVQWGD